MEAFKLAADDRTAAGDEEVEVEDGGVIVVLEIYVHHARNIHNICIFHDQDVYAKFSLTSSPTDHAISTRTVWSGGKNPNFDQLLHLPLPSSSSSSGAAAAVLKCEIWMLSRAPNFLEDQLLGFTLIPLSSIAGGRSGKLTGEFTLSSTDLFHSPAGTVKLTLSFNTTDEPAAAAATPGLSSSSISSEVVLLDPAEYGRIEFPDINVAYENQRMICEYLDMEEKTPTTAPAMPFLHLGAPSGSLLEDCDMTTASSSKNKNEGSYQNSVILSSTETSLSDDGNTADSSVKKELEYKSVFKAPMAGSKDDDGEESAMQKQIVEMYMRSMQQFTESLAKMKLPMDLDNGQNNNRVEQEKNNKDGSRVFYGSRAFF